MLPIMFVPNESGLLVLKN